MYWIVSIVDCCCTQLNIDDEQMLNVDTDKIFDIISQAIPKLELNVPDSPDDP